MKIMVLNVKMKRMTLNAKNENNDSERQNENNSSKCKNENNDSERQIKRMTLNTKMKITFHCEASLHSKLMRGAV